MSDAEKINNLTRQLQAATRALSRAGFTLHNGAEEWEPPLGPSASPLLAKIAERDAEIAGLRAALAGLHQVCQLALAGKDGKQYAYFESRHGTFVSAVEAMARAEASIAEVKS